MSSLKCRLFELGILNSYISYLIQGPRVSLRGTSSLCGVYTTWTTWYLSQYLYHTTPYSVSVSQTSHMYRSFYMYMYIYTYLSNSSEIINQIWIMKNLLAIKSDQSPLLFCGNYDKTVHFFKALNYIIFKIVSCKSGPLKTLFSTNRSFFLSWKFFI